MSDSEDTTYVEEPEEEQEEEQEPEQEQELELEEPESQEAKEIVIPEPETEPDTDEESTDESEIEEEEEKPINLKQVSKFNKEIIVIKPENRRTSHIMSKFEMTEYVSIRATQIAQHNNCMVDTTGLDDPIKMAKRELMMRKCPLTLRRFIGDVKNPTTGEIESYYEFWSPSEMMFAVSYPDVI